MLHRVSTISSGIPGWLAALALVLGLSLLFPAAALETVRFVLANLLYMAPIIGLAVILSASIRASGTDGLLARVFEGRRYRMILLASLFGAVTPICGVGVLPIIAGLLGAGVPLAPIMAFWLSSPITDPPMLTVTAGTLGLDFAAGKTVIAVFIGLCGGIATSLVVERGAFRNPLRKTVSDQRVFEPYAVRWRFWKDEARRRLFLADATSSGTLILKWLTLAFALESVLRKYLPPELIAGYVGAENAWAIPLAVTVGAPIYLDGYAALPLIRGLIDLGMSPGAAMAFLVSGGITSLYASVAVFALVRLPVFTWYLCLAMGLSAIAGYAFEFYAAI
jgi:uncharacterized membrane protein YraQ (UPF0718 family)